MVNTLILKFGAPFRAVGATFLLHWWGRGVLVFWVLCYLMSGPVRALEEVCLLIEPKDGPPVSRLLKGAKMTAFVPGRETRLGSVRYYTKAEFDALGYGWAGFTRRAEAAATRVWATLKPEMSKDARGNVISAVVRGQSHLTAGTVLAPAFYEMFRTAMGDDLVVLIPDRFTIYVFPRPMGDYKALGPKILEAYAEASYPVSYEVLLLNKEGLSALGSFRTE